MVHWLLIVAVSYHSLSVEELIAYGAFYLLMLPRYVSRSVSVFDFFWIGFGYWGSYASMVRTLFLIRTDLSVWYNICAVVVTLMAALFSFVTFFLLYFVMLAGAAFLAPFLFIELFLIVYGEYFAFVLGMAFYYTMYLKHGTMYLKFFRYIMNVFYRFCDLFGLRRYVDDLAPIVVSCVT